MSRGTWPCAGLLAVMLAAGGCASAPSMTGASRFFSGSGTVHVDVPVPAPSAVPVGGTLGAVSVAVREFSDARAGSPGRKVGNIRATVRDMHATELAIDQDVTSLLTGAAKSRLAAEGFRVAAAGDPADFVLDAAVRTFTLDIAGRDELAIVADATLRAGAGSQVAWKGEIAERSDRYAGVSGNSSASIAEYLGEGVAAFAGKLGAAVKAGVAGAPARPASARAPEPARPAAPAATLAREPAQAATAAREPAQPAATGRLWVQSTPARAKVYIDQVYYGLSPLKVELPPGIVQVRLVLDGFRPVTEKVSVRKGDTTEMEVSLEK